MSDNQQNKPTSEKKSKKAISRKDFFRKTIAAVSTGLVSESYLLGARHLKQKTEAATTAQPSETPLPIPPATKTDYIIPGQVMPAEGEIICNAGKTITKLKVINTGDRPIQVGSHFHFFEINKKMKFDRAKAFGLHLNILASTAVRFEPGEEKEVELVPFGGKKCFIGGNNLVDGALTEENKVKALAKAKKLGFLMND